MGWVHWISNLHNASSESINASKYTLLWIEENTNKKNTIVI